MNNFGASLVKSAKQAAEIAKGVAKPGTFRITRYVDGNPQVLADFSEEVLTRMNVELASDWQAESLQSDTQAAPANQSRKASAR